MSETSPGPLPGTSREEEVYFEVQSRWPGEKTWGYVHGTDTLECARKLLKTVYIPRQWRGRPQYRIVKKTIITEAVSE